MRGSQIVSSHRHSQHAVQDSYSVRCSPQVAGAARDTLEFARRIAEVELSSTIDNPIVLESGEVESNGNFHGEPLAFAADFLAIAAAEVGSISERRVDRLLDPHRSEGLPPFLAEEPGVNSGLMVAQYTAASLVAENRRLAAPASVDSVPTSGMQEDHVSMGWGAALKLRAVLDNLANILAVELCASARAQEMRYPLEPAPATGAVRAVLRRQVGGVGPDRFVAPELAAAEALIRGGAVIQAAESRPDHSSEPDDPRPAGRRALMQGLAAGGRAADAHEQPRPRGGRAPRGPGRLRRHRQGGAQLGGFDAHRADAQRAGGRRDAARPVGQAGRRVPTPTPWRRACSSPTRLLVADVGDVGGVPRARSDGPDDVRPDDGRLVDLHRHAGDPAGHLRDVRGRARKHFRRHARGHDRADRRARRHGRRAAARRDDERRRRALSSRSTPRASSGGSSTRYLDVARRRRSKRRCAGASRRRARACAVVDRPARQRGRGAARARRARRRRPTSSPTRPPPTIRSTATSRPACRSTKRPSCDATTRRNMCAARARHGAARARRCSSLQTRGAEVFDYGNNLRARGQSAGVADAFDYPRLRAGVHPPAVLRGQGAVPLGRALRRSGGHRAHGPRRSSKLFPKNAALARWIALAAGAGAFQGLPARICWLGYGERARGRAGVQRAGARAASVKAPIVIGRDHLDCGSVASPNRETEAMRDGSDAIADWPILNALVNTASGATGCSVHHGGGVGIGYSLHAGHGHRRGRHARGGARSSSAC